MIYFFFVINVHSIFELENRVKEQIEFFLYFINFFFSIIFITFGDNKSIGIIKISKAPF